MKSLSEFWPSTYASRPALSSAFWAINSGSSKYLLKPDWENQEWVDVGVPIANVIAVSSILWGGIFSFTLDLTRDAAWSFRATIYFGVSLICFEIDIISLTNIMPKVLAAVTGDLAISKFGIAKRGCDVYNIINFGSMSLARIPPGSTLIVSRIGLRILLK